jgi:hypothetical protein
MKPTPPTNECTECGREGLALARDVTHYHDMDFDGEWRASPVTHHEEIWSEKGLRLFCPDCGAYFEPPENIYTVNGTTI